MTKQQPLALAHSALQASPLNPRKHARTQQQIAELADNIAEHGVLQNLVVRSVGKHYEIAAGHGRYLAVALLIADGRLPADVKVPALVLDLDDAGMIEIGLSENTQRNDLHPLDEARAFRDLVDARSKAAGKKGAADAVKKIAERVGRTPRYVQKRVKIARELIPEWTELLEQNLLNVAAAQALVTVSAASQKEALRLVTEGYGKREHVSDRRARGVSVKEITDFLTGGAWRPLSTALFDAKLYTGDVDEIDGVTYATDREDFDALQKAAAADLVKAARAGAKLSGEPLFVEQGEIFDASRYTRREALGLPDPAGGIFVEKRADGEIRVHRGLFKTQAAAKADARAKAEQKKRTKDRAKQAKARGATGGAPAERKQEPPDPRLAVVAKRLAGDDATRKAVAVAQIAVPYSHQIKWLTDDVADDALRAEIKRRGGKIVDKGGALLAWCLKQTPATLNAILAAYQTVKVDDWNHERTPLIKKPTPDEQALFDHCGARLPDELTLTKKRAAPKKRTASKSKPKAKAKGKKAK